MVLDTYAHKVKTTETIGLNRVIIPLYLAVPFCICCDSLIINSAFFSKRYVISASTKPLQNQIHSLTSYRNTFIIRFCEAVQLS